MSLNELLLLVFLSLVTGVAFAFLTYLRIGARLAAANPAMDRSIIILRSFAWAMFTFSVVTVSMVYLVAWVYTWVQH